MQYPASPRRRPSSRRPSDAQFRRRRLAILGAVLVLLLIVVAVSGGGGSGKKKQPLKSGAAAAGGNRKAHGVPTGPPQLQVALASWQLPQPLSRSVALVVDGRLDLLGGLSGRGSTTTGVIDEIDPATGRSTQVGTLPDPVHDAAGAPVGSHFEVFGGGSASVTSAVQSYSPDVAAGAAPTALAGRLPTPRADLVAATGNDGTVYLAGGYDGTSWLPAVLATKDGTTFRTVGNLTTAVRYPAMAFLGGHLIIAGGESSASADTDAIQSMDPTTGAVTIAGHLPVPLAHAGAAVLNGAVYLFGGRAGSHVVDTVYRLSPGAGGTVTVSSAGSLPLPTSDMAVTEVGQTVYLLGGEGQLTQPLTSVVTVRMVSATAAASSPTAFAGQLLIADRGNDRLLLVNAAKQVLWLFPSLLHPAPAAGFYFPDDAFFINHGTAIITNQEDQDTIEELAYPSGKLINIYGHPNVAGSSPGYLSQPDDAYVLNDGSVTVADAKNCRILFLTPQFTYKSAIGHTGGCHHDLPNDVAYPNGDTPLADGNFLVSEIYGSYIDEVSASGQVFWSLKLPIAYPSDPQQLGPDLYLVADYSRPGGIVEFTREGQIVWQYRVTSGEGMLDHPSLAERLPNGYICVNDDYRHRVAIIDPATSRIVWQYGDTDTSGTAPGLLNTPDGFDLLLPDGTTPTHLAATGGH